MDLGEIFESSAFWLLTGVGEVAFIFMLIILKAMDQKEIMPLWVKIVTFLIIPVIAAIWASFYD